jgi:hypothetical protein
VDLARKVDYSVIIGLDGQRRTCRFDRFQIPWPETFEKVRKTVGRTLTLVDASGVGDPIHQQLARTAENFIPFQFTAKTRLKDDCVMGLALALEMHKRSSRTVGRYGTIKARS